MAKHYQELIAWQKAMDLVILVYEVTRKFPREELFGLTSQVRRAAVSVPSNIAEGQGRETIRDFLNFLAISRGSLQEVETQIIIGHRLGYVDSERLEKTLVSAAEVGRILNGLCGSLATSS